MFKLKLSAALPTALPDPANMHVCMYMCVRARVNVPVPERARVYVGDGQT